MLEVCVPTNKDLKAYRSWKCMKNNPIPIQPKVKKKKKLEAVVEPFEKQEWLWALLKGDSKIFSPKQS